MGYLIASIIVFCLQVLNIVISLCKIKSMSGVYVDEDANITEDTFDRLYDIDKIIYISFIISVVLMSIATIIQVLSIFALLF